MRNGADVGNGEIVSSCSLLSSFSEEDFETGENNGRGIAEDSVFPSMRETSSAEDLAVSVVNVC